MILFVTLKKGMRTLIGDEWEARWQLVHLVSFHHFVAI